jgi:hypothetical protein
LPEDHGEVVGRLLQIPGEHSENAVNNLMNDHLCVVLHQLMVTRFTRTMEQ